MSPFNRIGIVGLGLIGGSMAKALKKRSPAVCIGSFAFDSPDLRDALDQKAVDLLLPSLQELVLWSDLLILATPLSTLSSLAEEIARCCPEQKQLLVIDVGSVKGAVLPSFEKYTQKNIDFLSTHPMAGKETPGFKNSDADLFDKSPWIVTSHAKNQSGNVEKIKDWIISLGACPIEMDERTHDTEVALISHLPALLSRLLLRFVETQNKQALKIAGPGFKSMTRLAKDNAQMQNEIMLFNQEKLMQQLKNFLDFIQEEKQ